MDSENCPYDRCLSLGSQTKWGVGGGGLYRHQTHIQEMLQVISKQKSHLTGTEHLTVTQSDPELLAGGNLKI